MVPLAEHIHLTMGDDLPAGVRGPFKTIQAAAVLLDIATDGRVLIDIALDVAKALGWRVSVVAPSERLPDPPTTPAQAVDFLTKYNEQLVEKRHTI